jgi:hypothetical protein
MAGGLPAVHIARWNGTNWSPVGLGLNDAVYALTIEGSNLYAGGWFTAATNADGICITANRIAKWDGDVWSAIGQGLNGTVEALAISGGELDAGGAFNMATNTSGTTIFANRIAKWNGSAWSTLSSGLTDIYYSWRSDVYALAVSGSDIYAGGYFTDAGGQTITNLAKWNGSSWSAVGSGIPGGIYALTVSGSNLYAGGIFTTASSVAANYIAKWNGDSWSALGSGMSGTYGHVYALAASASDLYAGGAFTIAGGNPANYLGRWNGSNWLAVAPPSGLNGDVAAVTAAASNVYVAGQFTFAGSTNANAVAKWNCSGWSPLGSGISAPAGYPYYGGQASALALSGSDLYVGGNFTTAGTNIANSIAKWNGSNWSGLGLGLDNSVYALALSGNDLYAAGDFTTATNPDSTTVSVISDDGTNKSISLPATNPAQFFRLRRP